MSDILFNPCPVELFGSIFQLFDAGIANACLSFKGRNVFVQFEITTNALAGSFRIPMLLVYGH